jgi:hypothetical protein
VTLLSSRRSFSIDFLASLYSNAGQDVNDGAVEIGKLPRLRTDGGYTCMGAPVIAGRIVVLNFF